MTSSTHKAVSDRDDHDPTLSNFLDFVEDAEITIQSEIRIQELPGRGLGVVATEKIKPGTELMWVPTSALLQPSSVPESFIPLILRGIDDEDGQLGGDGKGGMRVHALLAAWITFGDCEEYEAWMTTWPSLEDMKVGMPLCWPEAAKGLRKFPDWLARKQKLQSEAGIRSSKRDGGIVSLNKFAVLPWDVAGQYATIPRDSLYALPAKQGPKRPSTQKSASLAIPSPVGLLSKQQSKFDRDLKSIQSALPHVSDILEQPECVEYASFLHAWLIVNSRCFYYVPTGCQPPEDSDEAMALCPAIDIFNHNDGEGGGCDVTHSDDGFTVKVDNDRKQVYQPGEELFVSYGSHGNDFLWVEYGFLLDRNKWDSVTIPDDVVLAGLSTARLEMLREKGYLGGYTLRNEGICWRTEITGWVEELDGQHWEEYVDGLWSPDDDEDEVMTNGISDGIEMLKHRDTPRRRVMGRIVGWVVQIKHEVENSLVGLLNMEEPELAEVFGDGIEVARQRHDMTVRRWRQIWETCMKGLKSIEFDCPGSFVVSGQPGRSLADLDMTVEDFIERNQSIVGHAAHEEHLSR